MIERKEKIEEREIQLDIATLHWCYFLFINFFPQIGEYLYSVNGQYVVDKSHTDVARIILMGSSTAYLVTFIEKDKIQSSSSS